MAYLSATHTAKVNHYLMRQMRCLQKWALLLATGLVLMVGWAGLLPSLAYADPGLRVDGALVMISVDPGVTYEHTMFISSDPSDPALDIQIKVNGFGRTLDGAFAPLSTSVSDSPYSACAFISRIGNSEFDLHPGDTENVTLEIQVPDNVGVGGRYALVSIEAQRADEGGLGTTAVVEVPVLLTVVGTNLVNTGRITGLVVDNVTPGQPINVSTTLANTGNHHYKASNEVILKDADGNVVAQASAPLTDTQIIPLTSNLFQVSIPSSALPKRLPEGQYQIESRVIADDGSLIGSQTVSFTIGPAQPQKSNSMWWLYPIAACLALLMVVVAILAATRKRKRANIH